MNDTIIQEIKNNLNIKEYQIKNTLKLLEEGNTIPFIARYRKEATGNLNEVIIKEISDVYQYQINLLKRKEDVIRLISEKEMLTDELKAKIMSCTKLVEIEDIYRPFKEKKQTKAGIAIANGLEGLAKIIMSFPQNKTIEELANSYKCEKVTITSEKLEGAGYIIKDYIADNAYYRKWIRNYIFKNGSIKTKLKKDAKDENKTYEIYYDYQEPIRNVKPHRILAINRGEEEKVLTASIIINDEPIIEFLNKNIIKNSESKVIPFVKEAIINSYKKNIFPSIEREIRNELTDIGNISAIKNFASNVEQLLLTPPMKGIRVLGFDPAFRTGCKLAALSETGEILEIAVIYPHEPQKEWDKSKETLKNIINTHKIDVVAIGNGTASRESEVLVAETIKDYKLPCKYIIVSEAGASVYSASKLAISEFPELDVSKRSAISIGRRLQDPLSELVKIDPKSIGVGLYQHDVKQKELDENLKFTVEKIVNSVGININTASPSILSYISGLTKKAIEIIIEERKKIGKFTNREELKNIKGITQKVYEQSIGFMRILEGNNALDKTNIHPESYSTATKILNYLGCTTSDIGTTKIKEKIEEHSKEELQKITNVDIYTIEDILKSLKQPIIDPRDELVKPLLKSDILTIDDLEIGMKLEGTVRNVVDFGAFIDIGLKNDGLIHISEMSDSYIKHPSEVLKVGDIINCYVLAIQKDKKKVNLTLKEKNASLN